MKKEEMYLNMVNDIKDRLSYKLESLGMTSKDANYYIDELLFNNLTNELEDIATNTKSYLTHMKSYFKDVIKKSNYDQNNLLGYHLVNNKLWVCDGFSVYNIPNSCFNKLYKSSYKEIKNENIAKNIKELIDTKIEINEDNYIENFNPYKHDYKKTKVDDYNCKGTIVDGLFGDMRVNNKYLTHACKLLGVKRLNLYRTDKNSLVCPILVLDKTNKAIGVILPIRYEKSKKEV